jgi:hypothetical protein
MVEEMPQDQAEKLVRKVREFARVAFANFPREQRVERLANMMAKSLDDEFVKEKAPQLTLASIRAALEDANFSENADAYADALVSTLQPIIGLAATYPKEFAEMRRRVFRAGAEDKWTHVNDLLSYGIDEDELHLHLSPAENVDPASIFALFSEGLGSLAKVVENNDEVKKITATSWIVATPAGEQLLKRKFGFTVAGLIDEQTRQEHFQNEVRPVAHAYILREDFLKRYG